MLRDDISIQYAGLAFFSRYYSRDKTIFFYPYSCFDFVWYKDNAVLIDNYTYTSHATSLRVGVAFDYMLDNDFSLGVNTSCATGVLTQYTVTSGGTKNVVKLKSDEFEGILRIDLSAGLRYNF